jgi:U3 small nucleolar ribonucleoprotein protein IMP4
MNRRTARLRKEYLYRKSLEGKAREEYEKKRAIRVALEEGKPIPTELKGESQALKKAIDLEDDNTAVPRSHIDDEYSKLGVEDPTVRSVVSAQPTVAPHTGTAGAVRMLCAGIAGYALRN